jgi:NAD(P)-dependent dehydrogenase (short-subunit alcohol dehydrogenase family)
MTKVAAVTGSARGIGAAIASALEAGGFEVARLDRTVSGPNEFAFDLGKLETHQPAIDAVMQRFGRIDCLVNNAGIASPKRGDFLELEPGTFDAVLDVNLRGTVFFTQAAIKAMLPVPAGHRRSIQFITSASAVLASPERLDYCMSKAGLAMFVKGLALRLAGEGIDVFEIRPGIIKTGMTAGVAEKYDALIGGGLVPQRRWGEPGDIAAICCAIASGALPFSTGSVIDAGGGLHIPRL